VVVAVVAGPRWTPLGCVAGIVVTWWLGRLEPASVARRRRRVAADLPLAADLLAACAAVGEPLVTAVPIVADAVGGPLAEVLALIDARTRLGADPESEWRQLFVDEQVAPLARTVVRSLSSGAPMAAGLERLADDARRALRTQSQVRARSVGVRCAGPLAVCFLPAFVLVGIVPTIVAAFGQVVLGQ
jgi:pilus assembly protein TadC